VAPRRKVQLAVIGALLFCLPTIPLLWISEGSAKAGILFLPLLAMLVGGLLVARRI
jgi:hypothetical protein